MIDQILQVTLGLVFSLFLPGFLIVELWFKNLNKLERYAYSIVFSLMISMVVSIFFGYNQNQFNRFGGLIQSNIFMTEVFIILLLIFIMFLKNMKTFNTNAWNLIDNMRRKYPKIDIFISTYPGMVRFFLRTLVFFGIVFGFQMFVHLYFRHTTFFINYLKIPDSFYFPFLTGLRKTDFINSILFSIVVFFIWNRKIIFNIKKYYQDKKQTFLYGSIAILVLISHYILKFWINSNIEKALKFILLFTILKYLFNAAFLIFTAISVYNLEIFKDQFSKFKKQIFPFLALITIYFFIIQLFQTLWRVLGNMIANTLAFLFRLTYDNVHLNTEAFRAPTLGVNNFIVGISSECSGIDSLLIFLSLFTVLLVLDKDRLDLKRMAILFIPGIIGTIGYNILRIYLLILVGVHINPEFAVDVFHSNIGWILFLVFFVIFWHFGSKWVYIKNDKKR